MKIIENWCEVRANNLPECRSSHSSFIYDECLYIYGGIDSLKGKLCDIMKINLLKEQPEWDNVFYEGDSLGNYF